MPSIDFDRLERLASLSDVQRLIGHRLTSFQRKESRGHCPLRCSEDQRACSFYHSQNKWYCHRCKVGNNPLGLFMAATGLGAFAAAVEMCRRLNIPVPYYPRSKVRRQRKSRDRRDSFAKEEEVGVE